MFNTTNLRVLLLCQIVTICTALSAKDVPELFDKDIRMDKLIIRNNIGFHFKKIVREVSQELFISRKIDVSSLFQGVNVLKQTQRDLLKFCKGLSRAASYAPTGRPELGYILVTDPPMASFAEARARCTARDMQLPEIYTQAQATALYNFMKERNVAKCFAGIIPDPTDAIQRFIATGFPIWRSYYKLTHNDGSDLMTHMLDDLNAKFMYTIQGRLIVSLDNPGVINSKRYSSNTYRDKNKEMSQLLSSVICEPRWDGLTHTNFSDKTGLPEFVVKNRLERSASPLASVSEEEQSSDKDIKDLCFSVASQAEEAASETHTKLTSLLALVDISVRADFRNPSTRDKRSIFLAKFIFTTGVKLIWTLFGFVQKVKMNNRVKQLETALSVTNGQVDKNSHAIRDMSQMLYGHSIAINQLTITTAGLDHRVTVIENKVKWLEKLLSEVINLLDAALTLSLVASLIARVQQSLNTGYDVLKDIIHSSLLEQTSPLVLPQDQIELVQNEVRKVSTAVLDPDFSKMQSVVITDPNDNHLLLVVVNVAAISRSNLELVKLVPIPYFEGPETFTPQLDYDTIVLNQLTSTYSVLDEQEEYNCLFERCYVSNVETSIAERSCGIPQLFDKQLDSCLSVSSPTNGVFLKPMLPDGVLFAFPGEVTAQLFCKDNNVIGPAYKLNGTGILQLPNGCVLSVTDKKERNTKVKGQPQYRMIDAEDIELVANGPLKALKSSSGPEGIHKMTTYGDLFNEHMSSVVHKVDHVDTKISNHSNYIWGLIGATSAILMLTILVIWFLYRYSGRFRRKVRDLREKVAVVSQQLLNLEIDQYGIHRGPPPQVPLRSVEVLRKIRARIAAHPRPQAIDQREGMHMSLLELPAAASRKEKEERIYQVPSSFSPVFRHDPSRYYPNLTPMMRELSDLELKGLSEDSEEVKALCLSKSLDSTEPSAPQ